MAKKASASGSTPAIVALTHAGIEHTLHPYDHDPGAGMSYGLEAATALGVDPALVFKTICAHVDHTLSVGIVPVNAMLDLKAFAAALKGKKAVMAQLEDAERATGYVAGGISPVGQRITLPTVLDTSAFGHQKIYVSGGRRGLDVGLAPADLAEVTKAVTATIARER